MAEMRRSTVVAAFPTVEQAERAVRELLQAGFSRDSIGLFILDTGKEGIELQKDAAHYRHEAATRTATGTVAGSVLGGVFGTLTAILLPGIGPALAAGFFVAGCVATGALAGGFTGLMSTVGLSEEESHWFQGQLQSGRPIVAVEATNRYSEALAIMEIHGAYDMTRQRHFGNSAPEIPAEARS
jgi:hypothetical protein